MTSDEFRKAVAGTRPLKQARRVELKRPAPAPVTTRHHDDEAAALAESMVGPLTVEEALDSGEDPSFLRDGVARQTLRKLRRGQFAIEASIDLHGLTRGLASAQVDGFLQQCVARGQRCVRIVHGKGLGVLKAQVRKSLPLRDEVLAYCEAPENDGGSGVLLVLLRSKR